MGAWERIALLYTPTTGLFHALHEDFVTENDQSNITLSLEVSVPVTVNEFGLLSLIRHTKTRIIVTFVNPNLSHMISFV